MNNGLLGFILASALFQLSSCETGPGPGTEGNTLIDKQLLELHTALERSPRDEGLYLKRGDYYLEKEAYGEAIQDYTRAWQIDSSRPEALFRLSDAYLAYFQSYDALQILEEAASRFPRSAETFRKLAKMQLILRQYEGGFRSLEKARTLGEGKPQTAFLTGMFFKETGDTARAINSFQEAIEGDPDLEDAWIILGNLQESRGHKIAARYYESALQRNPANVRALQAKGSLLARQGKLEEALSVFREMMRFDSQNEAAQFNAGLVLMDMDSIREAFTQFDQTRIINPLNVEAQYYAGLCAEILGESGKAEKYYQNALRLAPDYADARAGLRRLR